MPLFHAVSLLIFDWWCVLSKVKKLFCLKQAIKIHFIDEIIAIACDTSFHGMFTIYYSLDQIILSFFTQFVSIITENKKKKLK